MYSLIDFSHAFRDTVGTWMKIQICIFTLARRRVHVSSRPRQRFHSAGVTASFQSTFAFNVERMLELPFSWFIFWARTWVESILFLPSPPHSIMGHNLDWALFFVFNAVLSFVYNTKTVWLHTNEEQLMNVCENCSKSYLFGNLNTAVISWFSFLQKQNLFVDHCTFQIQNAETTSYILMYYKTMFLNDAPFYSIVCVNIL